jgi:transketolase
MKANQIRRDILNISYEAGACHIGSALSCVDILHDIFYTDKISPEQFLFGKASGVLAYYIILADLGYFPKEKLVEYIKDYPLPSAEVSGITHSFGSVGHALSVAAGMALGDCETDYHVLLSDGDLMEGSTYEAALFIRQHNLTNLHVYVDNNEIVACGKTEDILSLTTALKFFEETIPYFHNIYTLKGKGVSFMENSHHWHYKNLTKELRDDALCQIPD